MDNIELIQKRLAEKGIILSNIEIATFIEVVRQIEDEEKKHYISASLEDDDGKGKEFDSYY